MARHGHAKGLGGFQPLVYHGQRAGPALPVAGHFVEPVISVHQGCVVMHAIGYRSSRSRSAVLNLVIQLQSFEPLLHRRNLRHDNKGRGIGVIADHRARDS
jgi:hypothetical protein